MKNKFLHFGIVLFVIAAISGGILGFVNKFTKEVISQNQKIEIDSARRRLLTNAVEFKEDKKVISENFEFIPGYGKDGEIVGYVTEITEDGYAGKILFVIGIDMNGKITGLNVIENQETANLGARITEEDWQNHWIGKDSSYEFNKSVDGFAGATISPNAVYSGLMKALRAYEIGVIKK